MENEPRRFSSFATLAGVLLIITLVYAASFASKDNLLESWKNPRLNWGGSSIRRIVDQSILDAVEPQEFLLRRLVRGDDRIRFDSEAFSCHSDLRSGVCVVNSPVRINTNDMKVYIPSTSNQPQVQRTVKPYALQDDPNAMKNVTTVQILKGNVTSPACDVTHNVTAVIFSSGGFSGNLFHELDEMIIPLFITCHHFQSRLQFLVTDYQLWWMQKYSQILSQLSPYEAIDSASDGKVHCFPGAVVGLKHHDYLTLNSSDIPGGYYMSDFRHFLRQSYNLKIKSASDIKRPVLMLISHDKSRKFLNEDEMVKLMKELGFRVVLALPGMMSDFDKFVRVVNSCNVLVGAHGAGLTSALFLPSGAVVIQAVPLGLERASTAYYGEPAKKMGLNYLEYKIEPEESSLINKSGRDDQDLNINRTRFRSTLIEALQILGFSAPLNGRT